MKRTIGIVIVVSLALVLASILLSSAYARPAVSIVSLTNPGFDFDLSTWFVSSCVWSGSAGHNALGAVASFGSVDACQVYQAVGVGYNGVYSFSAWVNGVVSGTGAVYLYDSSWNYLGGAACNGEWNGECVASANASVSSIFVIISITGDGAWADDATLVNDEQPATPTPTSTSTGTSTPTSTPSPTATPGAIGLPLSSGSTVLIYYSWTFGEMAIVALLILLTGVFSARWMYDVVLQLWAIRGSERDSS